MPRVLGELPRRSRSAPRRPRPRTRRRPRGRRRAARPRRRRRSRRTRACRCTLTLWPSNSNGASASDTEIVPLLLLGVEVADRGAVLDPAHAGDRAGGEEQRLGERGLAGTAVTDEGDVADLRRRERLQSYPPRRRAFAESTGALGIAVRRGPGRSAGTGRAPGRLPCVASAAPRLVERSPRRMLDGRWRAKAERGLEPVGRALHRARHLRRRAHRLRARRRGRHRGADRQRQPAARRCSA